MRETGVFVTMMVCLIHSTAMAGAQATRTQKSEESSNARSRRLSPKEVASVIQAVEDEIYDYSQEKAFDEIGNSTDGPNGRSLRVSIYINPLVTVDGTGQAIYKDMPYGEILRIFYLSANGRVVLAGGPQIGFPVTQISHLTVFMDDGELCRDKAHWIRREFIVQETPSKELIDGATKRQLSRVGFSHYLHADVDSEPR